MDVKRCILGVLICNIGIAACELTLEVDLPQEDPVLVANSLFTLDEEWSVHVTDARSLVEGRESISYISDARVSIELVDGADRFELMHSEGGYYSIPDLKPAMGETYMLRVSADGYESVWAMDMVPAQIDARHTYVMPATTEPEWFDSSELYLSADVTITLNDPIEFANYYRMVALIEQARDVDDGIEIFNTREWEYTVREGSVIAERADPLEISDGQLYVTEALFTDKSFDGEPVDLTLRVHVPKWVCFSFENLEDTEGDGSCFVSLHLMHISEAYYDYATTYQLQRWYSGDGISDPVQVATNVENGLGVFAGYNTYVAELKPEE